MDLFTHAPSLRAHRASLSFNHSRTLPVFQPVSERPAPRELSAYPNLEYPIIQVRKEED